MIHVSDLSKNFGPVRALDGISFDVEEGKVIGFLGPNGAGKSTTLRILTGYLVGNRGTVRVNGFDVARDALAVRRSVGYLPEGVPLYPEMRVLEFLRFRARLKGISGRERRREIDAALEQAGVWDVRKRIVGQLSKGFRQRVGLADALLGRPRVLILDEPTVGLDPEQVIQFRQLLREVGQERTVLLSTHILSEVDIVCDGAIIISEGRIAAHDSAENLRRRVRSASPVSVEIAADAAELKKRLRSLPEVQRVERIGPNEESEASAAGYCRFRLWPVRGKDPREAIFALVRDRGWSLRELHREPVSLEDAFLEIVGGEARKERAG